ncbi:hypothetical protein GN244_ATG18548 [Phytophthora infestans]|uniref:HAT C-terminal dimerisation domain-containing protein n=1 Tax=Phytophthora infestans TaxID=4787 RepID=A0A833SWG4_PHYIN|nr:hypothetical protein GN244_ATG18548 [Phytophthora infestans]
MAPSWQEVAVPRACLMGRKKAGTNVSTAYTAIQQSGSSSKLSRSTPFQDRHLLGLGLTIFERNPQSGVVLAVACWFCISLGREANVGSKRKQTANTKCILVKTVGQIKRKYWIFFKTTVLSQLESWILLERMLQLYKLRILRPERNEKNEPVEGELPQAPPRQFVMLKDRDLGALIVKHRDRMAPHWTDKEMDAIEQEYLALCDQYAVMKSSVADLTKISTFEDAWNNVDGKFATLKRFAGGLTSAFPGTATVESDFSILKWEKSPLKSRLTNVSLEGVLHAKQFDLLNSINVSSDGKTGVQHTN